MKKIKIPKFAKDSLIVDLSFKKIEWELTEENIEKHRDDESEDYIDYFGAIYIEAFVEEGGDFTSITIADCDICDGLYDAIDEINNLKDDYEIINVYYTDKCETYGYGETWEHGEDIGHIIERQAGAESENYSPTTEEGILCRMVWDNGYIVFPYVDENGMYDQLDMDNTAFDLLIKSLKDSASYEEQIEWV